MGPLLNTEDYFRSLGADFLASGHHHSRAGWIQFRACPNCGSQNYHLGFNVAGKYFSCWKCGSKKTIDILRHLGAQREQIGEFFQELKLLPTQRHRPAGKLTEPKHRGPLKKAHKDYLESRNFDWEVLSQLWELEGIGLSTQLAWRIYIPIIENNRRVSWTTRAIGSKVTQRYLSANGEQEAVPHKECIYGIDYACHSIVITEGPTDAWRIGPGACALFGTAFTTPQISKLSRFPFRYILFDNEATAQRQARKLADQLSAFPGETHILECDAEDPGSMKEKDVQLLRKLARL